VEKKERKKDTHILENVSAINSNQRKKKKEKSTHETSSQQKLTFPSVSNINSSCQKKR
jgi:hypothetical protein